MKDVEIVELIADRFIRFDDRRVVDLASGDEVVLVSSTVGGPSEQTRWALRCEWFFAVRHRAIAELVDYGVVGETGRFEAWRSGPTWRGASRASAQARDLAATFLRANARIAQPESDLVGSSREGRPVVVPGPETGYVRDGPTLTGTVRLEACGIRIVARSAVSAIAELFGDVAGRQPRVIALGGSRGAGLATAVRELSRAARLAGFVPLRLDLEELPIREALAGRSLFAIASSLDPSRSWQDVLAWAIESPRPHVFLFTGVDAVPRLPEIWLEPVAASTLVSAIRPSEPGRTLRRRIESAARRARGAPGRFDTLLWGPMPVGRPPAMAARVISRAAEQPAAYGDDTTGASDRAAVAVATDAWPAPGELASLTKRMDAALALVAAGRHAPGERALRAAVAALARRHDWHAAARGALGLACVILRRGRPRDAQQALVQAKDFCYRAGDGTIADAAILSGVAATDLARLDEAESVLGVALTAALSNGDAPREAASRLALARCLFWRGKHEDADRVLAPIEENTIGDELAVGRLVALARVAIGRRDLEAGVGLALAAVEIGERSGRPSLVAKAACGAAFAHLAIGDRGAVDRDVVVCVRAARLARDPLRALRARLTAAESQRRAGRQAGAALLVDRLAKFPAGSLPATVRARCALLRDLLTPSSGADVVKRHVAATGLRALALFAPCQKPDGLPDLRAVVDDVVDILRVGQAGDDEAVMAGVCSLLRTRLRAAVVAFYAIDRGSLEGPGSPGRFVSLVSDGSSRLDPDIAARAVAAGQMIPPHAHHDLIEAGAPVRYGSETIGALVGRWAVGSAPDGTRAALLFTTAATAAGPAVAGAVARRVQRLARDPGDLLGVSAVMEQVRSAVERAAAAPFSVLIEGESGSGKELVARALHRRGPRRDRPFCTLNCAALPDDLVEAELFGHSRGAFTGAVAERPGVFEEAHTGTLFLDEIGELSIRAQAKVLRTIQEGELRRVGENIARKVDVRIVSATNRDLRQDVALGRFRMDLLYRLDVVRISLPALRDRREDVGQLVDRYWRDASERVGSRAVLSGASHAALARYDWPGNVRELQNVLAALAVRSPKRGVIGPEALPPAFGGPPPAGAWRLEEARRTFEERFVRAALVRTGGHRARAADELGVTRQGLTKLMSRLGISGTA